MDDRPDILRRKLGLYRSYLAAGVSLELARLYLEEIAAIEAKLAGLAPGAPAPLAKLPACPI
jgi:hypothetical protein